MHTQSVSDTGAVPARLYPRLSPAMQAALEKRRCNLEAEQAARMWAAEWHLEEADRLFVETIETQPSLRGIRHVLHMRGRR